MSAPFACDLTAIPVAERPAHQQATREIVAAASIEERDDGFTVTLPAQCYDLVASFVRRERLCCPFLTFVIRVAPGVSTVELRISGPEGATDFVRHELRVSVR